MRSSRGAMRSSCWAGERQRTATRACAAFSCTPTPDPCIATRYHCTCVEGVLLLADARLPPAGDPACTHGARLATGAAYEVRVHPPATPHCPSAHPTNRTPRSNKRRTLMEPDDVHDRIKRLRIAGWCGCSRFATTGELLGAQSCACARVRACVCAPQRFLRCVRALSCCCI